MTRGIDYGLGQANIDAATGIRYGVIHQHDVGHAWYDAAEPEYGDPTCGYCGHDATPVADLDEDVDTSEWERAKHECEEYACTRCERIFGSESAYGDEPIAYTYDADGISATSGESGDIFVLKSPYYTRAAYCSPCAPGACYLLNPDPDGARAYCFGHEWFEDGRAPYPVYRVADNTEVFPS